MILSEKIIMSIRKVINIIKMGCKAINNVSNYFIHSVKIFTENLQCSTWLHDYKLKEKS